MRLDTPMSTSQDSPCQFHVSARLAKPVPTAPFESRRTLPDPLVPSPHRRASTNLSAPAQDRPASPPHDMSRRVCPSPTSHASPYQRCPFRTSTDRPTRPAPSLAVPTPNDPHRLARSALPGPNPALTDVPWTAGQRSTSLNCALMAARALLGGRPRRRRSP